MAEKVRAAVPEATVSTRTLDVASLGSIRAFSDTMRDEGRPIHILVNNCRGDDPADPQECATGR